MLDARRTRPARRETTGLMRERGDLATQEAGRPQKASQDARLTPLTDLGLTYSQPSRYPQEASAPEEVCRDWVEVIA
jgi:hypothetical protein